MRHCSKHFPSVDPQNELSILRAPKSSADRCDKRVVGRCEAPHCPGWPPPPVAWPPPPAFGPAVCTAQAAGASSGGACPLVAFASRQFFAPLIASEITSSPSLTRLRGGAAGEQGCWPPPPLPARQQLSRAPRGTQGAGLVSRLAASGPSLEGRRPVGAGLLFRLVALPPDDHLVVAKARSCSVSAPSWRGGRHEKREEASP